MHVRSRAMHPVIAKAARMLLVFLLVFWSSFSVETLVAFGADNESSSGSASSPVVNPDPNQDPDPESDPTPPQNGDSGDNTGGNTGNIPFPAGFLTQKVVVSGLTADQINDPRFTYSLSGGSTGNSRT